MWRRSSLISSFAGSIPFRFVNNIGYTNLTSKPGKVGCWNSWLHYVSIANKSSGRTVREPVNIYFPGDQMPSPRKRNRITAVKEQDLKATGITQENDRRRSLDSSKHSNNASPEIQSSTNTFHESMSEATNSQKRKFICLEGQRLVEEGFKAGLKIHKLFLRKTIKEVPSRLVNFVEEQNVPVHHVSDTAIKNWSTLTTPPGIVGIFRKPKEEDIGKRSSATKGMPVVVICDNVREPGNLGSILRSVAGAGCERVLLSKGCCDPWDSKVLRAGCGAQFYLPITMNYPLRSLPDFMWAHHTCDDIQNSSESINSFPENEASERNNDTFLEKNLSSFALLLADSNDTRMDERDPLPTVSYTDMDYRSFHKVYLVVGGETEGLSPEIFQIAAHVKNNIHPGVIQSTVARLRIPLLHNMESLNCSNALSVIVYELLRQFQGGKSQVNQNFTS